MGSNDPAPPGPITKLSAPDPAAVRVWLLDLAGVAFVVTAIYIGIARGPADPAFPAFVALAGAYLGIKS